MLSKFQKSLSSLKRSKHFRKSKNIGPNIHLCIFFQFHRIFLHFSFYVCLRLAVRSLEVILPVFLAEFFNFFFEGDRNALCILYH